MNTFEAPNGEIINISVGRIITFGLTDEQNKTIRRYLPTKEYELYIAEDVTEIVAIPSTAQIILASLNILSHNSHIITFSIENCRDICYVFSCIVMIKDQVIIMNEKPVPIANKDPVFWQSTAFRYSFQDVTSFLEFIYKTDRKVLVL